MRKIISGLSFVSFKVKQRLRGVEVSETPWFDEPTLAWFVERMNSVRSYMEFGSGGSTVVAARIGVPTISVEGDHIFAGAVAKKIGSDHQVTLLRPPIGLTGLWGIPFPGTPTPARLRRWQNYINMPFATLKECGQEFPDFFLVDGRFRVACALRAALEANLAGRQADLLFDDYEREGCNNYHMAEELLGAPIRVGRSAVFFNWMSIQYRDFAH